MASRVTLLHDVLINTDVVDGSSDAGTRWKQLSLLELLRCSGKVDFSENRIELPASGNMSATHSNIGVIWTTSILLGDKHLKGRRSEDASEWLLDSSRGSARDVAMLVRLRDLNRRTQLKITPTIGSGLTYLVIPQRRTVFCLGCSVLNALLRSSQQVSPAHVKEACRDRMAHHASKWMVKISSDVKSQSQIRQRANLPMRAAPRTIMFQKLILQ
ncbi:hypothetical protein K474DRAFT_1677854 [Panus rudis PR-1116 ss-1]|nr:hypothetical protein K474DRAFT_1677854 [Panus rudis PR-1116 ss-1]